MARITVEDCLTKENNRFALVLLASKRTKQLLHGADALTTEARDNRAVVTALREVAEGVVRFMTEEDRERAEEAARRRQAAAEARSAREAETLSPPSPPNGDNSAPTFAPPASEAAHSSPGDSLFKDKLPAGQSDDAVSDVPADEGEDSSSDSEDEFEDSEDQPREVAPQVEEGSSESVEESAQAEEPPAEEGANGFEDEDDNSQEPSSEG